METDYKKKYEEALERAKKLRESKYQTMNAKRVVDEIFPELAESEDERIRKELVNFILYKAGRVLLDKETEHRFVAYLEKQKDIHFDYPGLYFYDGEKLHFQGNPALEDNPYDFALRQQEKQKEQKPAEKQDYSGQDEESEDTLLSLIGFIENWKEKAKDFTKQVALWSSDESKCDGFLSFLKSLSSQQKPSKWSDTDNIGWDEAFACVTRAEESAKNEEELQNAVTAEKWLKEIKFKYCVQHVKPEWSEEDKKIVETICKEGDLKISEKRWLKSLSKRFNLQPKEEPEYYQHFDPDC